MNVWRCCFGLVGGSLVAVGVSALLLADVAAQGGRLPGMTLDVEFELLDEARPGKSGGEVVDFFRDEMVVLTTVEDRGVWGGFLDDLERSEVADVRELVDGFVGVTSVAADPRGTSAMAMAVVRKQGRVGAVVYGLSAAHARSYDVGFHPDCVRFSGDGRFVLVACEGEFPQDGGEDMPGALAVLSLDEEMEVVKVDVYDFSEQFLADGVSLDGLRNQVPEQDVARSVEPEYVAEYEGLVYVSLQEANGLAVFDLEQRLWVAVESFGVVEELVVDASNEDGVVIDDVMAGLPMPDTLAVFELDGRVLIATANEGDARTDDGDVAELGELAERGNLADAVTAEMREQLAGVEVSTLDGDTDGDGLIDRPTLFGTRGWSLWALEDEGLVRVWDSGSLESMLARLDGGMHNVNRDELVVDDRSDDKGPEPEALATGMMGGERYVFVGLERQNGILAYRLVAGEDPRLVGYVNGADEGRVSPETLRFIGAGESGRERDILLVGYEGGDDTPGSVVLYGLGKR